MQNSDKDFDFTIGEYVYDTKTGTYQERTGFISFDAGTEQKHPDWNSGYSRVVYKATSSEYDEDNFTKKSKLFLKIQPKSTTDLTSTQNWYIEKMALYRKVLDKNNNIIAPDYESEESKSAEEFVKTGVLNKTYHYFNQWAVDPENPEAITDKAKLITITETEVDYARWKPVYNEGAQKVRAVTVKESNYFNILQSIAETFEAWLTLEISRDDYGGINGKKIKFKNYVGDFNYASFRYGLNLKDMSRTYDSKNITTKLIVKQNNNELAEGGFCTIQRAGANPTGENYLYDFQYYHNQELMDVKDYLDTVYYIDQAK